MRGKFIVFQGLDRSGKSTLSHLLQSSLPHSQWTTFPNRTSPIGQLINTFLSSTSLSLNPQSIHLLFTANRWQMMQQIQQKLTSGTNIICDRYWYSGVAYSTAKGLSEEWCMGPEKGLIEPDLIVYLHADPEELAKRKGYGGEIYERVEFQRKVYESYERVLAGREGVVRVEVEGKGIEELAAEVKELVKSKLFGE